MVEGFPPRRRDFLFEFGFFVPQLGLGHVEQSWFHHIREALPDAYEVVSVDTKFLLLRNGGIHCSLAFRCALAEK
jgi:agmatine/peptidylarginine deiminase